MEFKRDIDQLFIINKKAHAVIMSCKNDEQLEVAKKYVALVNVFYKTIECNNQIQVDYLKTSIQNLESVLKIKSKQMKIN